MRHHFRTVALLAAPLLGGLTLAVTPALSELRLAAQAQTPAAPAAAPATPQGKPEDTEVYEPVPKVVTPGPTVGAPPSDAIVLFDGKPTWISGSRPRTSPRPHGRSRTAS